MTKKRVQMDLTPNAMSRLEHLKEVTEAGSYAEVVKQALSLYLKMIKTEQESSEIVIRDKHGDETRLELFLPESV